MNTKRDLLSLIVEFSQRLTESVPGTFKEHIHTLHLSEESFNTLATQIHGESRWPDPAEGLPYEVSVTTDYGIMVVKKNGAPTQAMHCASCIFWKWAGHDLRDPERPGSCRRYPPDEEGLFGRTRADRWCGEYEAKP